LPVASSRRSTNIKEFQKQETSGRLPVRSRQRKQSHRGFAERSEGLTYANKFANP
jgi:hypothetical protein